MPADAVMSRGCGIPVDRARLRPGETVLDLGSGGGLDAFLAARWVGPTGRVIGVDATLEMLKRANEARREIKACECRVQTRSDRAAARSTTAQLTWRSATAS